MKLSGYTDRLSVRGGESIEVRVSSHHSEDFTAELVRIFSADPNPAGPGVDLRRVPSAVDGAYRSIEKGSYPGSFALVPLGTVAAENYTLTMRFQPRLLRDEQQTVASLVSSSGPSLHIGVSSDGLLLTLGSYEISLPIEFEVRDWYEVRLAVSDGEVALVCYSVKSGAKIGDTRIQAVPPAFSEMVVAARRLPGTDRMTSFLNGRVESPSFVSGSNLPEALDGADAAAHLAYWHFGLDISGDVLRDIGSQSLEGRVYNLPTRGVRGSRWSGREMSWAHAPDEYAAIHFHEGDLYDCGWATDFVFDVPEDLPSGVYGFRLRCQESEDIVPFFVRPAAGAPKAKVAVLFSTLTYLAYSNYPRTNYDDKYIARSEAWGSFPHHPALYPQFGRSLYDVHSDGSGVMFSSMLRPQLLMRPGFFAYIDEHGSGLRHFPADMHLVSWLAAKGIEADVVTDHDLDAEGVAALDGYAVVLTVTHPEYHTTATLDAIQDYISQGGNFGYLGGNGFYWRVATSLQYPGAMELRRSESGVRMWEVETGEAYQAFDARYGGLWLKNDRPPQRLVGIGMSAQGAYNASYYRRTEASRDPNLDWLFKGIDDEVLGDFGLSGGGAAGFELDIVDYDLGTPRDAIVLAVSETHSDDYAVVPEKLWDPDTHFSAEWQQTQIRADLTLIPHPAGNYVLSTGSIMFCGSLPIDGYHNNISRLLENFVSGCVSRLD